MQFRPINNAILIKNSRSSDKMH